MKKLILAFLFLSFAASAYAAFGFGFGVSYGNFRVNHFNNRHMFRPNMMMHTGPVVVVSQPRPPRNPGVINSTGPVSFANGHEFMPQTSVGGFTPLRLAFLQDIAIPLNMQTVGGIDLAVLTTKVENVYGFQLAGFAATSGKLVGVQAAPLSYATDSLWGIQAGGFAAFSFPELVGVQASFLMSEARGDGFAGAQIGGIGSDAFGTSYGLQVGGMLASSGDNLYGIQIGGIAAYGDMVTGLQVAGVASLGAIQGLCVAPIKIMSYSDSPTLESWGIVVSAINYTGWNNSSMKGLMLSGINFGGMNISGYQVGAFNLAYSVSGAQIGAINMAPSVEGVQIGVINYTSKLDGLQIGVINMASNAKIPVLPVINFNF